MMIVSLFEMFFFQASTSDFPICKVSEGFHQSYRLGVLFLFISSLSLQESYVSVQHLSF